MSRASLVEVAGLVRERKDLRVVFAELVRRHGDVVRVRLGPTTFFLLVHPNDVQRVLETDAHRFERVAGERRVSRRIVGEALFATEGAAHAWERSMVEPVMYERAAEMSAEAVVDVAARWCETLVPDRPVDVWASMERFCTELIVRVLVGLDAAEGRGRAIVDALFRTVAAMDRLPIAPTRVPELLPPLRSRFRRERDRLDALLADVIAERSRDRGPDVLSLLLDARDGEGRGFTQLQLRNELVTLYRGHTAMSTALALTWWQLADEPVAEARVHEEADALGDRTPGYADLARLAHTHMTFQESIRLYPPAWVLARRAVAEHTAGDELVRPGDRVLLSEWITHRDPRFWDEPLAFRPERFAPEVLGARHPFAYYPQGGGDKMCLGERFVVPMEAPLVLATVGRSWRFRRAPRRTMRLAPRATLKPIDGVWLVPERRK